MDDDGIILLLCTHDKQFNMNLIWILTEQNENLNQGENAGLCNSFIFTSIQILIKQTFVGPVCVPDNGHRAWSLVFGAH